MTLDTSKFKENLLRIMNEKNISQTQLSEDTTISRVAINLWVRKNKLPRLDTFVLIANALEVKTDELLEGMIK